MGTERGKCSLNLLSAMPLGSVSVRPSQSTLSSSFHRTGHTCNMPASIHQACEEHGMRPTAVGDPQRSTNGPRYLPGLSVPVPTDKMDLPLCSEKET